MSGFRGSNLNGPATTTNRPCWSCSGVRQLASGRKLRAHRLANSVSLLYHRDGPLPYFLCRIASLIFKPPWPTATASSARLVAAGWRLSTRPTISATTVLSR